MANDPATMIKRLATGAALLFLVGYSLYAAVTLGYYIANCKAGKTGSMKQLERCVTMLRKTPRPLRDALIYYEDQRVMRQIRPYLK